MEPAITMCEAVAVTSVVAATVLSDACIARRRS
jgi:hypothetical protein